MDFLSEPSQPEDDYPLCPDCGEHHPIPSGPQQAVVVNIRARDMWMMLWINAETQEIAQHSFLVWN